MKMKTSELTGAALDWAVARCEKQTVYWNEEDRFLGCGDGEPNFMGMRGDIAYTPSTEWAQGGPIIERELLQVSPRFLSAGYEHTNGLWVWEAFVLGPENLDDNFRQTGPTPLIAAMRCFVAAQLGDEVDVPEELAVA